MAKKMIETEDQKKARETTESIARSLQALVNSVSSLLKGPLKRKTILILLAHSSGLSQSAVDQVLLALESLAKDYTN